MINVAAIRMQQFGVQFYQASLTASDIDKLVRFEVLSYAEQGQVGVRGKKKAVQSKINWDLLERRIASNEKAYQRAIIRKKIEELVQVLRAVPAGSRPSVDSRRGDHFLRREAHLRTGRAWRLGRAPEGPGTRGHLEGDRRSAPPPGLARRHRSVRRRGVHSAGDRLRPRSRRSHRPDVRDDQCEAHAVECVAPGLALGPAALSGRSAGDGT